MNRSQNEYHKFKYYAALKTNANTKKSFLSVPIHVADNILLRNDFCAPILIPFRNQNNANQK